MLVYRKCPGILTLCLVLMIFHAEGLSENSKSARIIVISDLDDNFKITRTPNKILKVWNSIFSSKVFSGMPELYRTMQGGSDGFFIVSNADDRVAGRVKSLFEKRGPADIEIILRRGSVAKSEHKYNAISEILKATPGAKVILIGDDSQTDPEIYERIIRDFPDRILATYIRKIRDLKIPPVMKKIDTAYDIAFHEARAGRMSVKDALLVGEAVLGATDEGLILPKFVVLSELVIQEGKASADMLERMRVRVLSKVRGIVERRVLRKKCWDVFTLH